MVADYDQKVDALTDIFYVYQNKIDEIQKKAREEVSKLKKEQSEKSTKLSLKLFDNFSKKMSDLGYRFSSNMDANPDGPWVAK
jgi:molecular chaperone GrpE (heat shock protein)